MRRSIAWLLLVLFVTFSSAASADKKKPTTKANKAKAKVHEVAGTKFFKAKEYAKAAAKYQEAYALDPQPNYLYATAQAQRLDGDCTTALLTYHAYLETKPASTEAVKAQANIDRCEEELKPVPPVVVDTPPPVVTAPPPAVIITAAPPPRPSPSWTKDYKGHALVVGGAAIAVTGVVLYLDGQGTIRDHNSAGTYDEFIGRRDDLDRAQVRQKIGVSSMIVGGGLLIGGVIHYIVHSRSPAESAQRISANVSPGEATLVLTRSF